MTNTNETTAGNGAKMREALLCIGHIAEYLEAGTIRDFNHAYRNIQDRVKIALAEPPRNCDVGTAEEQAQRFYKFCMANSSAIRGMCDSKCPCIDSGDKCHCLTKWAQLPYEEGGEE